MYCCIRNCFQGAWVDNLDMSGPTLILLYRHVDCSKAKVAAVGLISPCSSPGYGPACLLTFTRRSGDCKGFIIHWCGPFINFRFWKWEINVLYVSYASTICLLLKTYAYAHLHCDFRLPPVLALRLQLKIDQTNIMGKSWKKVKQKFTYTLR